MEYDHRTLKINRSMIEICQLSMLGQPGMSANSAMSYDEMIEVTVMEFFFDDAFTLCHEAF